MRLGLAIIALLACDVACAQTPLPRSRPHAASDNAKHADAIRTLAAVPVPRARPSEMPAVNHAGNPAAEKSGGPVALVPVPRERPAGAMVRAGEAVSQTNADAKADQPAEPKPPEAKSGAMTVAAVPVPVARPVQVAPRVAEMARVTPLESPRVVPQAAEFSSASTAAPVPPSPDRTADNQDNTPMEEPVPPLAAPPSSAAPAVTRLDAKPAAPELPKLDPPPGEHTMQVAQLPEALIAILKRLPMPKKRPLSAWPRPDDPVFRDVTAPNPEAECDAAINSGILVAERLRLGRRGACFVPYAVKVEAIMVGRKRVDLIPPAKLRCGFALAIANWVRSDFAPAAAALGANFVGLRQLDSYNCRSMSSTRRLMSEHSMGNALDIAEVIFAGHHNAHLTDRRTQKGFRARLRQTACKRFRTVLGPGVPQHHDHIHVDLRHHYGPGGICHWNVL